MRKTKWTRGTLNLVVVFLVLTTVLGGAATAEVDQEAVTIATGDVYLMGRLAGAGVPILGQCGDVEAGPVYTDSDGRYRLNFGEDCTFEGEVHLYAFDETNEAEGSPFEPWPWAWEIDLYFPDFAAEVAYIDVVPPGVTLPPGGVQDFDVQAFTDDDQPALPDDVAWELQDTAAGAIDSNGLFTATTTAGFYPNVVLATATDDGVVFTDTASVTVTHGSAVSVTLMPEQAEVAAGDMVTYTLMAYDQYGNPWEVTDASDFSIPVAAGGVFTDSVYTSENAGVWTVTGVWTDPDTMDMFMDTATLTVTADMDNPVAIDLTPEDATVTAGDMLTYTVTAYDMFDNEWDVTAESSYTTTDPCGSFTANVYEACQVGTWTQMATYDTLTDTASVTVERGETVRIELTPEDATVASGDMLTYTVTAYDAADNPMDVTAESSYSTTDPGGSFTANVYEAGQIGDWTQMATYDTMTDTTGVMVREHGEAVRIELTPEDATVTAGDTLTYTVTAYDAMDRTWDVTAESSLTTTDPCGSFTGGAYDACRAGTWTQMATYDTLTDTTSVTVERGTTVRIELTPEDAQVIPGDLLTYTVTAYDALDNPLDVTAESSFTTTDPCGSFTANVYEACEVGVWTQTATYDMMVDSTSVTVGTQYFLPIILNNAMP